MRRTSSGEMLCLNNFPVFEDANGQIVEREQTTKRFAPGGDPLP